MDRTSAFSSVGRTSVSKTGCRGFKSYRARFYNNFIPWQQSYTEEETVSNTKKKDLPEKSGSFKESMATYFKGVKSEWGKITWPERRQVLYETLVIIAVVIFFTVTVLVLDLAFCLILHPTDTCRSCWHPNNQSLCK